MTEPDTTVPGAEREAVQATPDIEGTAPEAAQQTFGDFDVHPDIVAASPTRGSSTPSPSRR